MSDLSFLDQPGVPETRPCPRCEGEGDIDHPKFADAWALVKKTLAPVADRLKALQTATGDQGHHDEMIATAKRELRSSYPPQQCPKCGGSGTIPMEKP